MAPESQATCACPAANDRLSMTPAFRFFSFELGGLVKANKHSKGVESGTVIVRSRCVYFSKISQTTGGKVQDVNQTSGRQHWPVPHLNAGKKSSSDQGGQRPPNVCMLVARSAGPSGSFGFRAGNQAHTTRPPFENNAPMVLILFAAGILLCRSTSVQVTCCPGKEALVGCHACKLLLFPPLRGKADLLKLARNTDQIK